METKKFTDSDLQSIIGNVLRYGVLLALVTSLIGGVVLFMTQPDKKIDFSTFNEKDENIFIVFQRLFEGLQHGDGESIIFLGIILLFLTPAIRLILSLFSFFLEKDWLYIFITLIVISIIVFSVSFGFSH